MLFFAFRILGSIVILGKACDLIDLHQRQSTRHLQESEHERSNGDGNKNVTTSNQSKEPNVEEPVGDTSQVEVLPPVSSTSTSNSDAMMALSTSALASEAVAAWEEDKKLKRNSENDTHRGGNDLETANSSPQSRASPARGTKLPKDFLFCNKDVSRIYGATSHIVSAKN